MFDIQGHRGCRGLLPENTIEAFCHALKLGVTTLEMDTVISKDHQVVVSHEAFMNHEICLQPNGEEISSKTELEFNLYEMTYKEIATFDCGMKIHPRFPQQKKQKATKPLLHDVFEKTIQYAVEHRFSREVFYNIETKCLPATDNILHPTPEVFCKLLADVIEIWEMWKNVTIQSFDNRTLQYFHQLNPKMSLSLLAEPNEVSIDIASHQKKIEELGFMPKIYSPHYETVTPTLIEFAKKQKMKVIPWTVNDKQAMKNLQEMGVNGFITDYPNIAIAN
jgi:glycerophosphoryl diester phosphodiesterase